MGDWEEKRRKDREALDAKFREASEPLAANLQADIERATGHAFRRSVHEGSYEITMRLDEPRIEVTVTHDWGTGRYHSSHQPLGKPKIGLDDGKRGIGKTWYRPSKEGTFNTKKIVERIKTRIDQYTQQQAWEKQRKQEEKANDAAQKDELKGIKIPKGVLITRGGDRNQYSVKFAGTFNGMNPEGIKWMLGQIATLTKDTGFEPSWRSDLF